MPHFPPLSTALLQQDPRLVSMINLRSEELTHWQIKDITLKTEVTTESAAILGLNATGDSNNQSNFHLIKALHAKNPINTSPVDEWILCLYHELTEDVSRYWLCTTTLLRHYSSETVFAELVESGIHHKRSLPYELSEQEISAETRPLFTLFLGEAINVEVCIVDSSRDNFFKGLDFISRYAIGPHPLYQLVFNMLNFCEHYVTPKKYLSLHQRMKLLPDDPMFADIPPLFRIPSIYDYFSGMVRIPQIISLPLEKDMILFDPLYHGQLSLEERKSASKESSDSAACSSSSSSRTNISDLSDSNIYVIFFRGTLKDILHRVEECPYQLFMHNEYHIEFTEMFIRHALLRQRQLNDLPERLEVIRKLLAVRLHMINTCYSDNRDLQLKQRELTQLYHALEANSLSPDKTAPMLSSHAATPEALRDPIHAILRMRITHRYYLQKSEVLGRLGNIQSPRNPMHILLCLYAEDPSFYYGRIQDLIKTDLEQVNALNNWGFSPIIIATKLGYKKLIKLLIRAGADTSTYKCGQYLFSALENAKDIEIFNYLLALGVSPNATGMSLSNYWAVRDYAVIRRLLTYGRQFYSVKGQRMIPGSHADGHTLLTRALRAVTDEHAADLDILNHILLFFPDFILVQHLDMSIQSAHSIMTILCEHNARIELQRSPRVPRSLQLMTISPLVQTLPGPRWMIKGIRTQYRLQEALSATSSQALIKDRGSVLIMKAATSAVETQIKSYAMLTPAEQAQIIALYDERLRPLDGTEDSDREILKSPVASSLWSRDLIEVAYFKGQVISFFIFNLQLFLNTKGQYCRLFSAKIVCTAKNFEGLHLIESSLRILVAIKLQELHEQKSPIPLIECCDLLMPGKAIHIPHPLLSKAFPLFKIGLSHKERQQIYRLAQGEYEPPLPKNGVIAANAGVITESSSAISAVGSSLERVVDTRASLLLKSLLPLTRMSPECFSVVFISLFEGNGALYQERKSRLAKLGFTEGELLTTAKLFGAFFAAHEQQYPVTLSQKPAARL